MNTRTRTASAVWAIFGAQLRLFGVVLLICSAAQVVSVLSLSAGFAFGTIGIRDVAMLPRILGTIWTLILIASMLGHSDNADAPDLGFPRRLYRLPIRLELAALTVLLARLLVVVAMASIVQALHYVPNLVVPMLSQFGATRRSFTPECLTFPQSLLFASAWCVFLHAAMWRFSSHRGLGTTFVVVLMVTSLFMANEWSIVILAIYAVGALFALEFGLNGLRLDRFGAYSNWRDLREVLLERFAGKEMKGPREFASPLHAQAWLEQRTYVRLLIPTFLVGGAVSCAFSSDLVAIARGVEVALRNYTVALPFVLMLAAGVAGGFRAYMLRRKSAAMAFVMVRPISAPDIATSRMWASVAALSKTAALGLGIAVVGVWVCIAMNHFTLPTLANMPFTMWPVGEYVPTITRQLILCALIAWAFFWLSTKEGMIMLAVAATFMMLDLDQLGEIVPVFVLGTIITFAIAVRRGVVSWSAMGKILIFLIVVIFLMSLEVAEVDFRTERYSNASRIINYGMALLLTALIMLPVASTALEAARGRGR